MVQYEVIACSASIKGLLNKPIAPIIFSLLLSRPCNNEHNKGEFSALHCTATVCRKTPRICVCVFLLPSAMCAVGCGSPLTENRPPKHAR